MATRVVNASLPPNIRAADHCHDFYARLWVLGGEVTLTRDNNPETFRAGQGCAVPADCMHAEHVGPQGIAYVSGATAGRLRAKRSRATYAARALGSFMAAGRPAFPRIRMRTALICVSWCCGEITLRRERKPETYQGVDHCELPVGCRHTAKVGPEGVAYISEQLAGRHLSPDTACGCSANHRSNRRTMPNRRV
jgi:hypothetical protein